MNRFLHSIFPCLIIATTTFTLACSPNPEQEMTETSDAVRLKPPKGIMPIYLIQSYHLDPIGTTKASGPRVYESYKDAVNWLRDQAEVTGQKINAFSSGPMAEGIVNSGDELEYAEFMPGEKHTLGVHLHSHCKPTGGADFEWVWNSVSSKTTDEDEVRAVFEDQIEFVNQIYIANGVDPTENNIFHGTHNRVDSIMDELYGMTEERTVSYPNTFTVLEGPRGLYHPYRGPDVSVENNLAADEIEDANAPYIHVPISSGIIGVDQEHGPEGLVLGTTPYLKRDFILEFLEWREVERGADGQVPRVWVYGWGSHPYQTTSTYTGTDGRLIRESWEEMTTWLNDNFVGKTTSRENVMAEWANFRDVSEAFYEWETNNPEHSSADLNEEGETRLALAAIHGALEDAQYVDSIDDLPEGVSGHQFTLSTGETAWLYWSDDGKQTVSTLGLPRQRTLLYGDGTQRDHRGQIFKVQGKPVLVQAR